MRLDDEAKQWLRENSHKLSKKTPKSERRSKAEQARKLKAIYLADPKAEFYMTFQEFKDPVKRDAICKQYGLDLIQV